MKVFVYFNLHKKCWSIKALEGANKGRVVAHMNQLTIHNATFKVSEAGRQRVIKTKHKNVHAGVVGILSQYEHDFGTQVSYNPYKYNKFYIKSNDTLIDAASKVSFKDRLVTIDI